VSDQVRNNSAQSRFELDTEDELAIANYTLSGGVMSINHTEVPDHLEGRGYGSRLARGALDIARAEGLKVIPRCSFIRAFIAKHPEYKDLLP
jgi:uncharacterized protein